MSKRGLMIDIEDVICFFSEGFWQLVLNNHTFIELDVLREALYWRAITGDGEWFEKWQTIFYAAVYFREGNQWIYNDTNETIVSTLEAEAILEHLGDPEVTRFLTEDILVDARRFALKNIERERRRNTYKKKRRAASTATRRPALRHQVFQRDEFRCVSCKSSRDLTIDHIVPVKLGGDESLGNLQTLCRSCNSRKGIKDLSEITPPIQWSDRDE